MKILRPGILLNEEVPGDLIGDCFWPTQAEESLPADPSSTPKLQVRAHSYFPAANSTLKKDKRKLESILNGGKQKMPPLLLDETVAPIGFDYLDHRCRGLRRGVRGLLHWTLWWQQTYLVVANG